MEVLTAREDIQAKCQLYREYGMPLKDLIYPLVCCYASTYDAKRADGTTPFTQAFNEYHNEYRHQVMTMTGKGAFLSSGDIFPFIIQDRRAITDSRFPVHAREVYTSPAGSLAGIFGDYTKRMHMDTYHSRVGVDSICRGQLAHYWRQLVSLGTSHLLAAAIVQELTARQVQVKAVDAISSKIARAAMTVIPDDDITHAVTTHCDRLYQGLGYEYLTKDLVAQALAELCPGLHERVYPLFQTVVHMDTTSRKNPITNNTLRGPALRAIDAGDVTYLKQSIADAFATDPRAFRYSHHFCKDFPDLMETYRKAVAE